MNKNDSNSKPISIMNKSGITPSDLRKSLILLDNREITVGGTKYTIHYQSLYGDTRLYLSQNGILDPLHDSFVSDAEIEKFADCFPYSDPETVQDLETIYYCSPLLGTMRTVNLIPQFNAKYLFILYGLVNLLFTVRTNQNSPVSDR